jgi:outer membrane protein OmpA-like peptidoglycan-associated protein
MPDEFSRLPVTDFKAHFFFDRRSTVKISSNAIGSMFAVVALAVCALSANGLHAQQKDVPGCKDSPFLSRFPGTVITSCEAKDDDSFAFYIGDGKPTKTIEGKKYRVMYMMAPNATYVQVARNFNTALRQANWTNIWGGDTPNTTWQKNGTWLNITMGGGYFYITSIAPTTLTQDVTATAAELTKGIDANGHAVVPGILFDTGKADVKDESKPALDEVAKLLSQNLKLKLWVVGHTDNVGTVVSNLDLSKRRAAAVIAVLVAKYHIAPARLDSFGNGPYAPVVSNDTEDGRKQNRRVEIVKE